MTAPSPKIVVVIGVFFVSLSAILIRLSTAPPLVIAAYRMAFSFLLLAPSALRRRRSYGALLSPRVVLLCLLSGGFLALHFAAWISSLFHTTVATATVLVNTQPLFVVVFGFLLLGERISRRAALFMAAAFLGSAFLSLADARGAGDTAALGSLLAIGGAVTVSGYMLIGRTLRRTLPVGLYTVFVYAVAALLLTAMTLVAGHELFGYAPREYLLFLALAVFPTLLGHNLFSWSLKYLKTSFVSTSILGEPVFSSILAVFIFAEIPAPLTILGAVIVIVSLYFFIREDRRVDVAARRRG